MHRLLTFGALASVSLVAACSADSVVQPDHSASNAPVYALTPSQPCAKVCYVDGANGSDSNNGDMPATAKKTIQAALNQVAPGGEVRVFPGAYDEAAPNSKPSGLAGTYQFGLFFAASKPGVTLLGVDRHGNPIRDASKGQATITTEATNGFGTDGIFVDADHTTIQGLRIGPNTPGDNKTLEIVADDFTLQDCVTAVPAGGSIYIDDVTADGSRGQSYHIRDNAFLDATSVDISSGAGLTGPVGGREITGNTFDLGANAWAAISFNGSGTPVPWFTNAVGGAIIRDNVFRNGAEQYVRARGQYNNAQFDWRGWFNENRYDSAAVVLTSQPAFSLETYEFDSGSYHFTNARRIGVSAAREQAHVQLGDVVVVKR